MSASFLKVVSDRDRGFGLHARKAVNQLPKELFGLVAKVDEDDFDALVEARYPSLFVPNWSGDWNLGWTSFFGESFLCRELSLFQLDITWTSRRF